MRGRRYENWTDEIAEISTSPEFQNAKVRFIDNSVDPEYDIDTGEYTYPPGFDPVMYNDRARVIPIRWGVFYGGESQSNAKTVTSIRIQIPKNRLGRVLQGTSVIVEECADNPSLVGSLYKMTSDSEGSATAAQTFEAALDGDFKYEEVPGP